MAHGSFYMVGAYLGLSVGLATGNYWLALAAVPVAVGILGFGVERTFLRPLYSRGHLDQVLLTFGLAIFLNDVVKWVWGANVRSMAAPRALSGSLDIGFRHYPAYRLFLIGVGLVVALLLWWVIERTSLMS
ncbi:MAG: branched-chain amino acid ABC transporter permease [Thermoleophilia bacterium]